MWVFGLLLRLPGFDVWLCFVYLLGCLGDCLVVVNSVVFVGSFGFIDSVCC